MAFHGLVSRSARHVELWTQRTGQVALGVLQGCRNPDLSCPWLPPLGEGRSTASGQLSRANYPSPPPRWCRLMLHLCCHHCHVSVHLPTCFCPPPAEVSALGTGGHKVQTWAEAEGPWPRVLSCESGALHGRRPAIRYRLSLSPSIITPGGRLYL